MCRNKEAYNIPDQKFYYATPFHRPTPISSTYYLPPLSLSLSDPTHTHTHTNHMRWKTYLLHPLHQHYISWFSERMLETFRSHSESVFIIVSWYDFPYLGVLGVASFLLINLGQADICAPMVVRCSRLRHTHSWTHDLVSRLDFHAAVVNYVGKCAHQKYTGGSHKIIYHQITDVYQ